MNFTAIDFETANRRRASACAIGLAKVRDGVVVKTYYDLLLPEPCEFEFMNVATHGITAEKVDGSPTLLDAWEDIMGFIDGDVLVAHNCNFEQSVINQYMTMKGLEVPTFDYLCTLYMSKVNYPRRTGYKLSDLCTELLGRSMKHHHALEDAVACAELAVHHFGRFRSQDARELISALYVTPQREKKEWKSLTGIKASKDEVDETHTLFGQRVVMTGAFSSLTREEAVILLAECGGIYQSAVSKTTNFLVVGNQEYQAAQYGGPSVKMKQVLVQNEKGQGIQVLTEEDFLKMAVPD